MGQCDSFLCHQGTRIQFRWLCRNGQGLGYKDWVGPSHQDWGLDLNATKVPCNPLGFGSKGRCRWRENLAKGRFLLPERLGVCLRAVPRLAQAPGSGCSGGTCHLQGSAQVADLLGRVREGGAGEREENTVTPPWPLRFLERRKLGNKGRGRRGGQRRENEGELLHQSHFRITGVAF